MANFGSNNTTNTGTTTPEKKYADNETREFIMCLSERKGQYGSFFKGILDGFEYYLSETKNPDKNGNKQYKLQKSKTPLDTNYKK